MCASPFDLVSTDYLPNRWIHLRRLPPVSTFARFTVVSCISYHSPRTAIPQAGPSRLNSINSGVSSCTYFSGCPRLYISPYLAASPARQSRRQSSDIPSSNPLDARSIPSSRLTAGSIPAESNSDEDDFYWANINKPDPSDAWWDNADARSASPSPSVSESASTTSEGSDRYWAAGLESGRDAAWWDEAAALADCGNDDERDYVVHTGRETGLMTGWYVFFQTALLNTDTRHRARAGSASQGYPGGEVRRLATNGPPGMQRRRANVAWVVYEGLRPGIYTSW